MLNIYLPKLSNNQNQQLPSKGTKFQTSSFSFLTLFLNLKLILYNSKLQDQMCDWTKDFYFLVCKDLSSSFSTRLTHWILRVSLHSLLLWPTMWHPHLVTDQLTLSQPWGNGGTPIFQTLLRLSTTHLLQHSSTTSGAALARSWTSVPYSSTNWGRFVHTQEMQRKSNVTRIVGAYRILIYFCLFWYKMQWYFFVDHICLSCCLLG